MPRVIRPHGQARSCLDARIQCPSWQSVVQAWATVQMEIRRPTLPCPTIPQPVPFYPSRRSLPACTSFLVPARTASCLPACLRCHDAAIRPHSPPADRGPSTPASRHRTLHDGPCRVLLPAACRLPPAVVFELAGPGCVRTGCLWLLLGCGWLWMPRWHRHRHHDPGSRLRLRRNTPLALAPL
jgi:hypothetical protein